MFLFAHQDDEFGIFEKVLAEINSGRELFCAYLTDGGKFSRQRNQESLKVLGKLGVPEHNIFFPGADLRIPDGLLPEHLDVAASWIQNWLSHLPVLQAIYIPAWEGGHQDHDALHAIALTVIDEMGLSDCSRQFSLYNSYKCPGQFFRVFRPLSSNGPVEISKVAWINRFKFLSYCLSYPSQKVAWLGLFPFVTLHYFTSGLQMLQPVSRERICQRPHEGTLYYEKRKFYTWEKLSGHLSAFLQRDDNAISNASESGATGDKTAAAELNSKKY